MSVKKQRRFLPTLLFIFGMSLLGFLAQFQWLGYIVITIYLIFAMWYKRPAAEMFTLALITLGIVPLAIILSNWLVAQNFAAYSFMFFLFGIVTMTTELKRDLRRQK